MEAAWECDILGQHGGILEGCWGGVGGVLEGGRGVGGGGGVLEGCRRGVGGVLEGCWRGVGGVLEGVGLGRVGARAILTSRTSLCSFLSMSSSLIFAESCWHFERISSRRCCAYGQEGKAELCAALES